MRTRKTALVLVLLVIGVAAAFCMARHESSDRPAIAVSVLGYTNCHDYLCARVRLTNMGNSSISYDSQATGPSGWLRIQSTNGWADESLSAMTGSLVLLEPGSNIVFRTSMPTNTLRWQFGFNVRVSSLRERALWKMPDVWWSHVPLLREWPRLLPPSRARGGQEIRSEVFELPEASKRSSKRLPNCIDED
jgi:hypothetical protein